MLSPVRERIVNLSTRRWLARLLEMAPARWASGALAFFAVFYLLDWASFIEPFGPFGITPWNPQTGFALAAFIAFGRPVMPMFLVAPFLMDLISRASAVPTLPSLLVSLASGSVYAIAFGPAFAWRFLPPRDVRGLSSFFLLVTVTSAVATAVSVAIFSTYGLVAWNQYQTAFVRLWVGDLIGIAVFTPAVLTVLTKDHRLTVDLESAGLAAVLMSCLAFALASTPPADFRYFYILFLPVVWIAARYGYHAVLASLVAVQVVVAAVVQFDGYSAQNVTTLQGLLLILSITGMVAGMLVTQNRLFAQEVRVQQELHAKLHQMGSLGEFAGLIAHEVNQPLMAAGTYTRLAIEALGALPRHDAALEVAEKAHAQISRAAEVVRRLRDLVRTGRLDRNPVAIGKIIHQAVTLMDAELERAAGIDCEVRVDFNLPEVNVDRIQIEQVLLNLIRNSLEAFQAAQRHSGRIVVSATEVAGHHLRVCVEDDGPGIEASSFDPGSTLQSTKPSGFGIGLSLSRTIVEAHGGTFAIESLKRGTRVCFTLPRSGAPNVGD